MAILKQTTYFEKATGSPNLSGTQGEYRMVRDIFVEPGTIDARYQAMKDFLGFPKRIVGTSGNTSYAYISRQLPDFFEFLDADQPALICTSFNSDVGAEPGVRGDVEPWNDIFDVNEYAQSHVVMEYRTTNYDVLPDNQCVYYSNISVNGIKTVVPGFYLKNFVKPLPDEGLMMRYIERYWRYAGRVVTIPIGFTAFAPDAPEVFPGGLLPNKGGFPVRETMVEMTYVQKFMPVDALPITAMYNAINTVNDSVFDLPGWNIPTGCALYIGGEPKNINKSFTGDAICDMEQKFLVAPHVVRTGPQTNTFGGWNRGLTIIPGNTFDYRRVVSLWQDTLGQPVIPSSDFSTIFRAGQP